MRYTATVTSYANTTGTRYSCPVNNPAHGPRLNLGGTQMFRPIGFHVDHHVHASNGIALAVYWRQCAAIYSKLSSDLARRSGLLSVVVHWSISDQFVLIWPIRNCWTPLSSSSATRATLGLSVTHTATRPCEPALNVSADVGFDDTVRSLVRPVTEPRAPSRPLTSSLALVFRSGWTIATGRPAASHPFQLYTRTLVASD